jgi:hypothetical protein
VVENEGLASEMMRVMETNLEHSVRIDETGRPEGESRQAGVPRWKLFKLRALMLVSPLIKRQL